MGALDAYLGKVRMDPIERLLAERECERLIYRYCHLVDHGEAAKVAELFTEDGVWASPEVTRDGRETIAKAFQARQDNTARMSRHVCSTPMIDNTARPASPTCGLIPPRAEPGRADQAARQAPRRPSPEEETSKAQTRWLAMSASRKQVFAENNAEYLVFDAPRRLRPPPCDGWRVK